MKIGDKRGQFYVAAVIVLVAAIIGFATITNHVSQSESLDLESFEEELTIELQKVYDSGIESGLSDDEISNNLENFTELYVESSNLDTSFYFIFGDENDLSIGGYSGDEEQKFLVSPKFPILDDTLITLPKKVYNVSKGFKPDASGFINLTIDEVEYPFRINQGNNFHFIILYEDKNEKHIVIK